VAIAVTNSDAAAPREVSIRLPADTLDRWDIEPASPAPLRDEMRGSTRYLVYEAPAGGQAQITINLQPHRIGQSPCRIEVTDHRGRMLALLNERLDVTP
jgi:hypothetical protein